MGAYHRLPAQGTECGGSARWMFEKVTLRYTMLSHPVYAPCCRSPIALPTGSSSMHARTSSWSSWCLYLSCALLTWVLGKKPKPANPVGTAPTIAHCLRCDSATYAAFSAFHFLLLFRVL